MPIVEIAEKANAVQTINYRAFRVGDQVNTAGLAAHIGKTIQPGSGFSLYHRLGKDGYFLAFHYGVVVFCNTDRKTIDQSLRDWKEYFVKSTEPYFEDELLVQLSPDEKLEVFFDQLSIGRFDDAVNEMIMLHLAQSVVLDHFFHLSQGLLSEIKEHTEYMREKGRIRLSQRATLKFIGKALAAKNHIAENLFILDSPEQTWEDEYLAELHQKLTRHLEQTQRYRVIENTLKIIEDNLAIYATYNDHRESSRLEWIIIILIVIEVVDTLVSKVL